MQERSGKPVSRHIPWPDIKKIKLENESTFISFKLKYSVQGKFISFKNDIVLYRAFGIINQCVG